MLTAERQHSLSLREQKYTSICPPRIITVCCLLPTLGLVLTDVPQQSIGRTPIYFGQTGSLGTGQGTRSCRLAQVCLARHGTRSYHKYVVGSRACLGRRYEQTWSFLTRRSIYPCFFFRFFETESIAVITMMLLKYRVEVKEEPEFVDETFEQRFARITASESYLTNTYAYPHSLVPQPEISLSPNRVPLVFKRR